MLYIKVFTLAPPSSWSTLIMWLFCGEPISRREPEKLAVNELFLHNQSKNLNSTSDIILLDGNAADGINQMQSLQ